LSEKIFLSSLSFGVGPENFFRNSKTKLNSNRKIFLLLDLGPKNFLELELELEEKIFLRSLLGGKICLVIQVVQAPWGTIDMT
jgi:hypothetical protein